MLFSGRMRDDSDPMEIDLFGPSYLSDHYVTKMPSWLANIYTSLTERLIAKEKLVSESITKNYLVTITFAGLDCIILAVVGTTTCNIQTGSRR
jgi:hypothetical protein